MDIRLQKCEACGSTDMRNYVVRDEEHPPTVYARCIDCGELVAAYTLSGCYFHHKGIDSWLRTMSRGQFESGRRLLQMFEEVREGAIAGFADLLSKLDEDEKPVPEFQHDSTRLPPVTPEALRDTGKLRRPESGDR
jgi:ribosomal protein L32